MGLRSYTAHLSPVNPDDKVKLREFHQFDSNGDELVFQLDPSANSVDSSLDETLLPGTCYLVDVNDSGASPASEAFALVPPPINPPPPPPPPTGNVPVQPSIESIDWTDVPSTGMKRAPKRVIVNRQKR